MQKLLSTSVVSVGQLRPHLRKAGGIALLKALGLGFSFAGTAWAARCLGPDKLGLSGMITATVGQLLLLTSLGLDPAAVRSYKRVGSEDERARLITIVQSVRNFTTFTVILLALGTLVLCGIPSGWGLGVAAAIPLLLFQSTAGSWLFQAKECQDREALVSTIAAVCSFVLSFAIIRPDGEAGIDVVVQALVACMVYWVGWQVVHPSSNPIMIYALSLGQGAKLAWRSRWFLLSGLLVYLYTRSELPILGYVSTLSDVGIYRTALGVSTAMQVMSTTYSAIIFPRVLDWSKGDPRLMIQRQSLIVTVLLLLAPVGAALGYAVGPTAFTLCFGSGFATAGYAFSFLVAANFVSLAAFTFGCGVTALERERDGFFARLFVAGIGVAITITMTKTYGMIGAAASRLVAEVMSLTANYVVLLRSVKK